MARTPNHDCAYYWDGRWAKRYGVDRRVIVHLDYLRLEGMTELGREILISIAKAERPMRSNSTKARQGKATKRNTLRKPTVREQVDRMMDLSERLRA